MSKRKLPPDLTSYRDHIELNGEAITLNLFDGAQARALLRAISGGTPPARLYLSGEPPTPQPLSPKALTLGRLHDPEQEESIASNLPRDD